jgi:glutathione S-transferase
MTDYTLVIGNKNLSSWSLRAWLMLKAAGVHFKEILIPLDQEASKKEILRYSPSGLVPALLRDGRPLCWDSLAIGEYLAETFPKAGLWPEEASARAHARSICAEMHSGFAALRSQCSMNMKKRETIAPSPEVTGDIRRIEQLWADARALAGNGDFLYGHFTIADAMYAPVVSRFITYGIRVGSESGRYRDAIRALPAFAQWNAAAQKET